MFNADTYFRDIHSKLSYLSGYEYSRVTSEAHMEEVLQKGRRTSKFFAVDDSDDGYTFEGGGASYYEKRIYTVFILIKIVNLNDMSEKLAALDEARNIYRAICSKMVADEKNKRNNLETLDVKNIRFHEYPGVIAFNTTGLFFTFTVENPTNLTYDQSIWNEQ